MRITKILVVLSTFLCLAQSAIAATNKSDKQVGIGFGPVGTSSLDSFPYALQAVLEGTYRKKNFGLSILATATSSTNVNGTYQFGSGEGYQQTFLEPRVYLGVLKLGFAVGLNLSGGTSGEIQSMVSYGPMAGIEIPFKRFSLGVDGRYLLSSAVANPAPISIIAMFRFGF